jgi:hypothetical protein
MIQRIVEDDDGNTALEFDEEGLEYLIDGLMALLDKDAGTVLTTPAVWTNDPPWWRFWNRKKEPVVGEVRLRRVA